MNSFSKFVAGFAGTCFGISAATKIVDSVEAKTLKEAGKKVLAGGVALVAAVSLITLANKE